MNDLKTVDQSRADPAPKAHIGKGGALEALVPTTLDETFRLAKALSQSGDMVPKHFQGKPEATMAAIVRGMEIGLAPMQALSHIAVINGRPSLWGDAMVALMQRAGHHIDVEVTGEGDNLTATATLTRGDTGKEVVRTFSMSDAKKAGLSGKQGPWQQYPKRMLSHRARSWAIRDGAADALMGMQYAEEVGDYGPDAARDVTPARSRRGGVSFLPAETVAPTAPAPEPVERDEIFEGSYSSGDPEQGSLLDDDRPSAEELAAAEAAAREAAAQQEG